LAALARSRHRRTVNRGTMARAHATVKESTAVQAARTATCPTTGTKKGPAQNLFADVLSTDELEELAACCFESMATAIETRTAEAASSATLKRHSA